VSAFARRGPVLSCEAVSLESLAERFGTPLYVYSARELRESFLGYDRAFAAVSHRICYAVKANGCGAVLRLFAGLGAGADIVSGGELKAALRAGFPPERVVFSGVGKTEAELREGLDAGIGEFNAESGEEIARLSAIASGLGRRARVTLRVNPDIDPRSHPYISTGLRENKFGVAIGQAPEILRRARALPGIEIVGVQSHIGSQITDLRPLGAAARALAELSSRLIGEGFALESIDFGGGMGIDYQAGSPAPEPAALAAEVLPALDGLPLTLLLEPGRSLVARAGVLLTRVLYVKDNGAKRFVIVDAGMNDLLRPSLYQAFHRIEPVVSRGREAAKVDVVGPVCETGDFFARDRELERVEAGALLAVRDTGAYGSVMASNYNMRMRPAEVMVDGGEARLVRRRETFEDLIATEVDASAV
jgi:diaminopimelate decarboxylase